MKKWGLFLGAALFVAPAVHAQDDEGGEEEGTPSIADFTENFQRSDGLFPLYRDTETGEVYLEIEADQFGEEYIYFAYTENGPVEAGHFRGNFRDNRIVVFNRNYNRVEVEAVNTSYYFDPDNALARSADANIARAPLANVEIKAQSRNGDRVLISADALFENQSLHRLTNWRPPDAPPGSSFVLGELSEVKTQITEFHSFPENTDVRVEYVFDNPSPVNYGGTDITDARSVAILVQHSLLAMPEPGFEPRLDDFRVGYFTNQVTDLTSADAAPYRDVINRWRLVPSNPEAPISDPVDPIVFWIENTTPAELRPLVRDAALAWNVAFEAAGFSNAVQVMDQPDDAEWDAGDVRYNVLRWTSSPNPPFGGYGPSFTNPRTGEIIGADIMLEYVFITNRLTYEQVFDTAGLSLESFDDGHGHDALAGHDPSCLVGSMLQSQLITARAALVAQGASEAEIGELTRQGLYYLILHEIGHTLGLNHNMRSTSTVPLAVLSTPGGAPSNSVMDYPAINITPPGQGQGQYAVTAPGPYDIWAIQFGYTPRNMDVPGILARSTEPALAFGNDADDLRSPGTHIDPRVMINDLSDDPISWAERQVDLIDRTLPLLPERMLESGESYQALYNGYMILTGQRAGAATVASRWIGGVFNNRSVVGQPGAAQPLVPVPAAEQRRALAVIEDVAFAPDAFTAGEELLTLLQVQRRGFDAFGQQIDPQPHARALQVQRSLLDHLLHPNVLTRLTDTRRYGGDYPVSTYLGELTGTIFDADRSTSVNTYRQNLQIEYTNRLIAIASGAGGGTRTTPGGMQALPNYDHISRAAALAGIERIRTIASGPSADEETRIHRAQLLSLIEVFDRR